MSKSLIREMLKAGDVPTVPEAKSYITRVKQASGFVKPNFSSLRTVVSSGISVGRGRVLSAGNRCFRLVCGNPSYFPLPAFSHLPPLTGEGPGERVKGCWKARGVPRKTWKNRTVQRNGVLRESAAKGSSQTDPWVCREECWPGYRLWQEVQWLNLAEFLQGRGHDQGLGCKQA